MKKILTAILAFSLCGVMLTACSSEETTAEAETTTTVSEAVTEAVITEAAVEATEKETEEETAAAEAVPSAGYESLDAFAKSGDAFNLETTAISAADSYIYNYVKTFDGASGMYIDAEATDGSMTMVMGMAEDMISIKMYEATSATNMSIIFKDSKMYMIDEASKSGYYMTADESMMEDYDVSEMLGDMDFDAEIENAADVKVTSVEIGGEEYTFEVAETGGGFLFSKDEKLIAILSPEADSELTALKINEFTGDVPTDIFEIPSDYQLVDLEAALAESVQ